MTASHLLIFLATSIVAISWWAKAGGVDFQPFTFHSLRRRHAIEFLRSRTGTLHELQFRLGHSTIKTTEESPRKYSGVVWQSRPGG